MDYAVRTKDLTKTIQGREVVSQVSFILNKEKYMDFLVLMVQGNLRL